jgi:ADP-glucose pyrophosphorylase
VRIEDGSSVIDSSVLLPGVTIGRRCKIKRCIIDEDCVVPDGMQIGQDPARISSASSSPSAAWCW